MVLILENILHNKKDHTVHLQSYYLTELQFCILHQIKKKCGFKKCIARHILHKKMKFTHSFLCCHFTMFSFKTCKVLIYGHCDVIPN